MKKPGQDASPMPVFGCGQHLEGNYNLINSFFLISHVIL